MILCQINTLCNKCSGPWAALVAESQKKERSSKILGCKKSINHMTTAKWSHLLTRIWGLTVSCTNKIKAMVLQQAQWVAVTQNTAINRRTPVPVIRLTHRSVPPVALFASLMVKICLSFQQVVFALCVTYQLIINKIILKNDVPNRK